MLKCNMFMSYRWPVFNILSYGKLVLVKLKRVQRPCLISGHSHTFFLISYNWKHHAYFTLSYSTVVLSVGSPALGEQE